LSRALIRALQSTIMNMASQKGGATAKGGKGTVKGKPAPKTVKGKPAPKAAAKKTIR
jgi:hypothetical protein